MEHLGTSDAGHQQQSGSHRDTTAATDWGVQSGPWDAALYHDAHDVPMGIA